MQDSARRQLLIEWVARSVMPHEPVVRAWLRRRLVPRDEIDELIQEGYCRLAAVKEPGLIGNPAAFFLTTVRNLLANHRAHKRVVRIDAMSELSALAGADPAPNPERISGDRRELARVESVIARLPERCRRVLELRKIQGLSQREVARELDIPETTVENEGVRAVRLMMDALRQQGDGIASDYEARRAAARRSK